jgi:small subunit ribosomal protein S16
MLKMRLQRYGRKNNPTYRVVVTDSRNSTKTGNHVDVIGSYEPKAGNFQIDGEKAKHWISKGVQVSDTVHNFLVTKKVIEAKKKNVLPRKSPIVDEAKLKAEAEAKAAAEAKAKEEADKVNDEVREGALGQAAAKAAEAPTEEAPAATEEETVAA